MKLIHCADLHLDAPMESHLSADKARERKGELRATFARLVRTAAEEGVSAILIAGDLFDSTHITKSTKKYVLELITAHPEIEFFYLAGNHDRGTALFFEATPPQNLHAFGDAWTSYSMGEVTITGSERPNLDTLSPEPERINILLLHGQERSGKGKDAPEVIHFGKLRGKHIDYVALGHIHDHRVTRIDDRCVAAYSGCLEGRGFDECGQKGYVLLETVGNKLTHKFIPFATRRLHTVECDVTDIPSQLALEDAVSEAVKSIPRGDMVKVVLTGTCPPAWQKDLTHLSAMLGERFYFAKVKDASRLLIRPEDYQNDISLRGEFIRRVLASGLGEEEKERVIACGLRALSGEEVGL